ncbi:MAG: BREX-3 system P-loop-containing protein BrxF [Erysipelotrichaceae bacterium]|nr:BREX-3 system P-loop-containing protein BrxF [Erysipelotrichaceae bacterium]
MSSEKHNLLLIIGRPGSGKSKFLHNYSKDKGIPILNLDNILGKQIPEGKDANYVYEFIRGFLASYKPQEILIDKKTILYQKDTDIDLLDFLKEISANKTVITTWTGWTENNKLIHVCEELGTTVEYPLDSINCQYMELK